MTIARHTARFDAEVGVALAGYTPDDGTMEIIFSGALLGMLATRVLPAFGRSSTRAQALLEVAGYGLDEEDLIVEDVDDTP